MPCKEANEALTYAILSIFCFGFVLGPVAISKAVAARRLIAEDPRLTGYGKANAAIVVASVGFFLWIINMIGRVTPLSGLRRRLHRDVSAFHRTEQ